MNVKALSFIKALLGLLLWGCCLVSADTLRVACVGNSITYGGMGNLSYPQQLDALMGHSYDVNNYGVSGTTLLRQGDYPYWETTAFSNALAFDPDIVIILLGTNDSKPQNWVFADQYVGDYLALIDTFRSTDRDPKILVGYPPPVFIDLAGITGSIIADEIVPMVTAIIDSANTYSVDYFNEMAGDSALFSDGVHPNATGYTHMARIAAQAIRSSFSGTILNFTLDQDTLEWGQTALLRWTVSPGSEARLNGNAVALQDSLSLGLSDGGSYELIASGERQDTLRLTLTSLFPGMIRDFRAFPPTLEVDRHDSARLVWAAAIGSEVRLDGQTVERLGNQWVAPEASTEYLLTTTGDNPDTIRLIVPVLPAELINRAWGSAVNASSTAEGFDPAWVVDGQTQTAWHSASGNVAYLDITLANTYVIDRVVIHWDAANARLFHVQVFDSTTGIHTVASQYTGQGGEESFTGLDTPGQGIRILMITAVDPDHYYGIREVAIFGGHLASISTPHPQLLPEGLRILDLYPNPFNSDITIHYAQDRLGLVDLRIFDLRGAQVISLHAGQQSAGHYQIHWDGHDQAGRPCPGGIYFLTAFQDLQVHYEKITLLK